MTRPMPMLLASPDQAGGVVLRDVLGHVVGRLRASSAVAIPTAKGWRTYLGGEGDCLRLTLAPEVLVEDIPIVARSRGWHLMDHGEMPSVGMLA